jgi:hypothetical protein
MEIAAISELHYDLHWDIQPGAFCHDFVEQRTLNLG